MQISVKDTAYTLAHAIHTDKQTASVIRTFCNSSVSTTTLSACDHFQNADVLNQLHL